MIKGGTIARFGSIYSTISDAGKDWLDEHADELDDSLVTFARKLARTPSTTRGMQVSDIGAIGALVCTPDFCGLTAEDVYNIIAHEEHVLEWSFLDLYNKETGVARRLGTWLNSWYNERILALWRNFRRRRSISWASAVTMYDQ